MTEYNHVELRYTDTEVIDMTWNKWKRCIPWILASEAVGALSGFLSRGGMKLYESAITKPQYSPPGWLFPVVWVILYALMGISVCRVYSSAESKARTRGINLFVAQLIVNFFWSPIFFNAMAFGFAAIWLVLLWLLVLWMIWTFRKVDPLAAWFQIPYLIWLTFAAYLNFAVWIING